MPKAAFRLRAPDSAPHCIRFVEVPTRPRVSVSVRALGRPFATGCLVGTTWLGETHVSSVVELANGATITVHPVCIDLDPMPEVPSAAEFAALAAQSAAGRA